MKTVKITGMRDLKFKKTSPMRILKFIGEANIRLATVRDQSLNGKWLRNQIIELGPAFIKLGQFISTRNDLFNKEITNELLLLQDNIPQVPFNEIKTILNESYSGEEFANDYNNVFSYIDENAIASASIGQVHIGKLKNSNKLVAIKVHKPFIAEKINDDIMTLKNLINILLIIGYSRAKEFESIIKEYERFLSAELDFRKEMNHMIRFKKLLSDLPVKVPAVSVKYSSEKVLVMEYVKSIKISDLKSFDSDIFPKNVANSLINIFLYQIIKIGYVHSDPHPGNIGILNDGTIVLYDFGNVVEFSEEFKSKINQLIISLYQKDVEEFVELLIELEILYVKDDIEIIEIKAFFGYFFKYLETLDLSSLKVSMIQNDLQGNFRTNFKVNQDFLSLFRVFSLLDGTYSKLDPNFSYINAIAPYTEDLMNNPEFYDYRAKKDIQKLTSYPRILQNTDANILRLQQKTKNMNVDFRQLQFFVGIFMMLDNYEHFLPFLMLYIPFLYYKNKKEQ
uniref:Protein kinase domain-containing protein n=1 Tax=viral metagenome TaxID=1070528 RepID=A0A6C0KTV1_9ZZZZ